MADAIYREDKGLTADSKDMEQVLLFRTSNGDSFYLPVTAELMKEWKEELFGLEALTFDDEAKQRLYENDYDFLRVYISLVIGLGSLLPALTHHNHDSVMLNTSHVTSFRVENPSFLSSTNQYGDCYAS